MGEKIMGDNESFDVDLSTEEVRTPINKEFKARATKQTAVEKQNPGDLISCLRNERVIARFIPRESSMVPNPKHVFYGSMADNAVRILTVPILESSGAFVNVLTNDEKNFLEEVMGLDNNALSVYLRENNFWSNFRVRLIKGDNFFNLSNPEEYIKYKVLLANKDRIAPSIAAMQDSPKVTYEYVIIAENEESKESNKQLSASMEAFMILGKIQDEKDLMKFVAETMTGRPISAKATLDFIKGEIYKVIQSNAKTFITVANDPWLRTKVLITQCVEHGIVRKRGDFYYLTADNSPLCEASEDPTINVAAKYLCTPKRQEIKFTLEAKLKSLKD